MQKLVKQNLAELQYYWATETDMEGIPVLLSRTGYTGEDGFEVYLDARHAAQAWDMIFEAGKEHGIKPIGLGARDTLRFEMRYCLYGNDIDQTTNALEAGLGWITKFDKGDFIGRDRLLETREAGLKRKLVGFEVAGAGIPRPHLEIHCQGRKAGHVTSGTFSPSLKKGIGMGYVETACSNVGTNLEIQGKEPIPAVVVKGPFYKQASHK
jgi:aminomethyltransferase